MTEKQLKAIELHKKGFNCFQSVACVFAPELGVDEETALEDACKVEHDLSEQTYEAIKRHALSARK